MKSLVLLTLCGLMFSGCATTAIALDALVGGVSIFQRYEDRQAQRDQTEEIKKLREEIGKLRQEWRAKPQ